MDTQQTKITVETTVHTTAENAWKLWTTPDDIMQWNHPSDDWHTTKVENDLKNEGTFLFRMETKDGNLGFDHSGKYSKIINNELIEYTVSDGRKSNINFASTVDGIKITETFEPEATTPADVQRDFCKGVLDNFKAYAENLAPSMGAPAE